MACFGRCREGPEWFFDAVIEEVRRNPRGFSLRPEPLTEKEADEIALSAVHRVRGARRRQDRLPLAGRGRRYRDLVPQAGGDRGDPEQDLEAPAPPLIVFDTSVVVSALVGPPGSPHDRLIDKVASGEVLLALSDDFLRELSRVVGYPDVEPQIVSAARALRYGFELGVMGNLRPSPRHDWPSIRDPKDGWMLDLA